MTLYAWIGMGFRGGDRGGAPSSDSPPPPQATDRPTNCDGFVLRSALELPSSSTGILGRDGNEIGLIVWSTDSVSSRYAHVTLAATLWFREKVEGYPTDPLKLGDLMLHVGQEARAIVLEFNSLTHNFETLCRFPTVTVERDRRCTRLRIVAPRDTENLTDAELITRAASFIVDAYQTSSKQAASAMSSKEHGSFGRSPGIEEIVDLLSLDGPFNRRPTFVDLGPEDCGMVPRQSVELTSYEGTAVGVVVGDSTYRDRSGFHFNVDGMDAQGNVVRRSEGIPVLRIREIRDANGGHFEVSFRESGPESKEVLKRVRHNPKAVVSRESGCEVVTLPGDMFASYGEGPAVIVRRAAVVWLQEQDQLAKMKAELAKAAQDALEAQAALEAESAAMARLSEPERDARETLGVGPFADRKEIMAAYREKLLRVHSDSSGTESPSNLDEQRVVADRIEALKQAKELLVPQGTK